MRRGTFDPYVGWGGPYRVLVGRSEGRTTLGKPRYRWDDYVEMDLQEVGWSKMNWIDLFQNMDRWRGLVNAVTNIRVQ